MAPGVRVRVRVREYGAGADREIETGRYRIRREDLLRDSSTVKWEFRDISAANTDRSDCPCCAANPDDPPHCIVRQPLQQGQQADSGFGIRRGASVSWWVPETRFPQSRLDGWDVFRCPSRACMSESVRKPGFWTGRWRPMSHHRAMSRANSNILTSGNPVLSPPTSLSGCTRCARRPLRRTQCCCGPLHSRQPRPDKHHSIKNNGSITEEARRPETG